ncbi:MAG: ORF6N domain-containing protein [Chlamydiae bacterium]|nr:ORF6N domain-containing protein [Chlamydiota bacterium]MBI3266363.1 ORF6N domain-containing protein [Chlamydiota bacterium]
MNMLIPQVAIEQKILMIRGYRVMMDKDLARLYGVPTKVLNQAVKRNIERFPEDFMFRLSPTEKDKVVTNCDHLSSLKFSPQLPSAFTEQGVAMLSSVLRSERAVQVNIAIMRVFVKLREILSTHKDLAQKLSQLERKIEKHDGEIHAIFEAIRQLMAVPEKPKRKIGFHIE